MQILEIQRLKNVIKDLTNENKIHASMRKQSHLNGVAWESIHKHQQLEIEHLRNCLNAIKNERDKTYSMQSHGDVVATRERRIYTIISEYEDTLDEAKKKERSISPTTVVRLDLLKALFTQFNELEESYDNLFNTIDSLRDDLILNLGGDNATRD